MPKTNGASNIMKYERYCLFHGRFRYLMNVVTKHIPIQIVKANNVTIPPIKAKVTVMLSGFHLPFHTLIKFSIPGKIPIPSISIETPTFIAP